MRCIPGSERVSSPKDDEKISSIARFEALMAEHDQRKQAKLATSQSRREGKDWDLDEESEMSDSGEVGEDEDDAEGLEMSDHEIVIPTPAKRALDYISGRIPPPQRTLSPARSPPIPFLNSQAMEALHGNLPPSTSLRPRTGIASSRNGGSRPNSLALPSRSISTTAVPSARDNGNLQPTDTSVKRRSSTSVKRLSFSEFAKRLSSTSSLLLVQTNASSSSDRDGSRRGSSEYGVEEESRSLDEVNKVLGKMSVEEAEEVVGQLGEGGMLSLEEQIIDATTEEGQKALKEFEEQERAAAAENAKLSEKYADDPE